VGWQVTATTIRCDLVDDFAALMVYGDGATRCAYFNRWNTAKAGKKRLKNCKGPDCPQLIEFKERAFSM
jgi:hypothetical protein